MENQARPSSDPQEQTPRTEPERPSLYVLKEGDSFLVTDGFGDITGHSDGLFTDDTRLLSGLRLTIGDDAQPAFLSSAVSRDNVFFTAHLTNPPLTVNGQSLPANALHIERTCFLWQNRLYLRIAIRNYSESALTLPVGLRFATDFRDIFEIRGARRPLRGSTLAEEPIEQGVALAYQGLDDVRRQTALTFSPRPEALGDGLARFYAELPPHGHWQLLMEAGRQASIPTAGRFRRSAVQARRKMRQRRRRGAQLTCSQPLFQAWFDKARADLALLTSDLPTGPYPYAGIPWFSTPFGRDAIITALQTLWIDPALAKGVLAYLAGHQAAEASTFRDAQPGKIMHETRKGEMTATNELPFGFYYGGVDTTPLFILLAGAWYKRTGDEAFISRIWPQLTAAVAWIESRLDASPLGLLDYQRGECSGLANQGWKDSHDSVSHADGRLAEGPIALVEVQGYAWRALLDMAGMAARRGEAETAGRWRERAERLRQTVEQRFWLPDRRFYALALDGAGRPCQVEASNAGHLLYVGLPDNQRASQVIRRLLSPAFNTGWGIRTLSGEAARFNPMSYHNGSVWPHDVGLCAAGLARYGERQGAATLLGNLFEAALAFSLRLPELFCGFSRASSEQPIVYPVACQPQSWASGAVFMLLQATLGLEIDADRRRIRVNRPALPDGVDSLTVDALPLGDGTVSLEFRRVAGRTVAFLQRQQGVDGVTLQFNQ